MDLVLDNIIWLIIAAAGIVRWWKSSQEAKEEVESNEHQYTDEELEEFLEQAERRHPQSSAPPPLPNAAPATAAPPVLKRQGAQPQPPDSGLLEKTSAELERQQSLAEQVRLLNVKKGQRREKEDTISIAQKRKPIEAAGSLRARLGNRGELRQAFVLKEILEKPVGLQKPVGLR